MAEQTQAQVFGRAVRELRHEQGIAQDELARRSEMNRSYMGNIERGEKNLTLPLLLQVAAGLALPASQLLIRAEALGIERAARPPRRQRVDRPPPASRRP